ncbi:alpha/beta fold hydrolase [Micromonospora sp. NPDC047762]|uniref:alpha/beta fold hydrolase n=1 Tax=Micromonospora sp. NPDC047762 TaxID=3364255 RepID=UPI00371BA4CD
MNRIATHPPVGSARPARTSRFGLAELRLGMAAPRPAAGLTSEWRLVDGLRTHTRRSADPGTGTPPVVLVHGLAVSHRYLTPLAVALSTYRNGGGTKRHGWCRRRPGWSFPVPRTT